MAHCSLTFLPPWKPWDHPSLLGSKCESLSRFSSYSFGVVMETVEWKSSQDSGAETMRNGESRGPIRLALLEFPPGHT